MLTQTQASAFVNADGDKCPFCGSKTIEGTRSMEDIGKGRAAQPLSCCDCHKEWWSVFMLVGVKERVPGDEYEQNLDPLPQSVRLDSLRVPPTVDVITLIPLQVWRIFKFMNADSVAITLADVHSWLGNVPRDLFRTKIGGNSLDAAVYVKELCARYGDLYPIRRFLTSRVPVHVRVDIGSDGQFHGVQCDDPRIELTCEKMNGDAVRDDTK